MKKGSTIALSVIGWILLLLQLLSLAGNAKRGIYPTLSFASSAVFVYDVIVLLSSNVIGIIGVILLAVANWPTKKNTPKRETGKFTAPRAELQWNEVERERERRHEAKRENTHKTISLPLVFSVLAFLLSAAALVAVLLFINSVSGKDVIVSQEGTEATVQKNIPRYDPYDVESWTPQPAPANGQKFKDFYDEQEKVALLRINTAYAKGYYIILKPVVEEKSTYGMSFEEQRDYWNRKHGELHIYMRSNSTVNLLVPLGTYEVYFAKGDTWYGESYLFGPDTVYQRGKKYLEFYEESDGYSDCTIDLYSGSNSYHKLYTEGIEASEFPKLVITVPESGTSP